MQEPKQGDQTARDDENNTSKNQKMELLKEIRSVWQGYVESNHDLRFWRPLY